jgi:hypothetical protein
MPRHATSEDAARNGFAPANLAPVAVGRGSAAVARPGLALEPLARVSGPATDRRRRRRRFGLGFRFAKGLGTAGAGGPPGSRS